MNSRLSDELANLPSDWLRQLRTDVDELRNQQRLSGRSGVIGYTIQNDVVFDLEETVTDTDVTLKLTFTGDGSQLFPVANPSLDIFLGGTGEDQRMDQVFQRVEAGDDFALLISRFLVEDKTMLQDETRLAWTVSFQVVGTMTYYAKGYAVGTSPGTVTVERL